MTSPADTRKPYSVVGSARATPAMMSAWPTSPSTAPPSRTAVSWARTARVRLGEVRKVGTTVLCPYSRATAMAPNRAVPSMALKANAISDCWSAAVAMNALLPSMSVPNMTTAASMPAMTTRTARKPHGSLVVVSLRISARTSRSHVIAVLPAFRSRPHRRMSVAPRWVLSLLVQSRNSSSKEPAWGVSSCRAMPGGAGAVADLG